MHIERIKAGGTLVLESDIEETKITENDRNEEKNQSIFDSVEDAIDEKTRIGEVNEQAQTMKAKQQERMNPTIEKEGNDLDLDDE